jgi:adenosine deaminase
VLLQDANLGSLIGTDIHLFPGLVNLFTAETCEKTILIQIDKQGFNLFLKGFLAEKYDRFASFLKGFPFLKQTRANKKAFYSLVMMMNSKKVMANTIIVE